MEPDPGGGDYLYLYGVTCAGQALPEVLPGIAGAIAEGGLVALVERVAGEDFRPDALEARLQSIEWVGRLARKHDSAIELAVRSRPVIPARLCTLYSTEQALRAFLVENRERLLDTLDRLTGREEWGLKVYCDEAVVRARLEALLPDPPVPTAAGPGQAYLLARQREARAAEAASERVDELLGEVLATLGEVVCDSREKSLLPSEATGRKEAMVLNVAALVETAGRSGFQDCVEALASLLADEGLTLESSGPWPPYSFTGEENPP